MLRYTPVVIIQKNAKCFEPDFIKRIDAIAQLMVSADNSLFISISYDKIYKYLKYLKTYAHTILKA